MDLYDYIEQETNEESQTVHWFKNYFWIYFLAYAVNYSTRRFRDISLI